MRHFLCLLCCLVSFTTLQAASHSKLLADDKQIYVISEFEQISYFTVYSLEGEVVWEVPFNTSVISCKIRDDHILLFSKRRDDSAYYLTALNKATGELFWEKTIWAPMEELRMEP